MIKTLHIVYASTSGHTEYVIEVLIAYLKKNMKTLKVEVQRAELTSEADLLRGEVLLLASGTWNTGDIEGQLNPHMHFLLRKRATKLDLDSKPVAILGCGDARYFYTCRAADYMEEYADSHNGWPIEPTLRIINEPYGQEKAIEEWGKKLVTAFTYLKPQSNKGSRRIRVSSNNQKTKVLKTKNKKPKTKSIRAKSSNTKTKNEKPKTKKTKATIVAKNVSTKKAVAKTVKKKTVKKPVKKKATLKKK